MPIDAFGVGTACDVFRPMLPISNSCTSWSNMRGGQRERSEGKATWPGRKQIYRSLDSEGKIDRDLLTAESAPGAGQAMLVPVMRRGRRVAPPESLAIIRRLCGGSLRRCRGCDNWRTRRAFAVEIAPELQALAVEADKLVAAFQRK